MEKLKQLIIIMRPYQYVKNIFIFAPAFFAMKITDINIIQSLIVVFILFSIMCSSVYIFNDIMDRDLDLTHPTKQFRPIASGKISIKIAVLLSIVLLTMGGGGVIYLYYNLFTPLLCYLILNILYTIKLKSIPILDIFIIASGFVIRLYIGSFIIDIEPSHWIVIVTFLLALFLALAKRRDDVIIYENSMKIMRPNIQGYNKQFLDIAMSISASIVMLSYILYTISPEVTQRFNSNHMYFTSIFVLLGIFRYMQLSFVDNNASDPSRVLLKDKFLQLVILAWIISFILIIYISKL